MVATSETNLPNCDWREIPLGPCHSYEDRSWPTTWSTASTAGTSQTRSFPGQPKVRWSSKERRRKKRLARRWKGRHNELCTIIHQDPAMMWSGASSHVKRRYSPNIGTKWIHNEKKEKRDERRTNGSKRKRKDHENLKAYNKEKETKSNGRERRKNTQWQTSWTRLKVFYKLFCLRYSRRNSDTLRKSRAVSHSSNWGP